MCFQVNSDVGDHSTVVLKRNGPKKVLCDCSRCRAMVKQQSTMLIFLKKLTEQVPDSLHSDSLHSFQNARQVGLLLLPTVLYLQYHTSKIQV